MTDRVSDRQPGKAGPLLLAAGVVLALVWLTFHFTRKPEERPVPAPAAVQPPGFVPPRSAAAAGGIVMQGDPSDVEGMIGKMMEQTRKDNLKGQNVLQSRYESEPVDRAWASAKQQALTRLSDSGTTAYVDPKALKQFESVCRSSLCRIRATLASQSAAQDWMTIFSLNAAKELSQSAATTTVNPDGSATVEIYAKGR